MPTQEQASSKEKEPLKITADTLIGLDSLIYPGKTLSFGLGKLGTAFISGKKAHLKHIEAILALTDTRKISKEISDGTPSEKAARTQDWLGTLIERADSQDLQEWVDEKFELIKGLPSLNSRRSVHDGERGTLVFPLDRGIGTVDLLSLNTIERDAISVAISNHYGSDS